MIADEHFDVVVGTVFGFWGMKKFYIKISPFGKPLYVMLRIVAVSLMLMKIET